MTIPKIIHYCWFGHSPLPDYAKKCIASWQRYLPDYEIKEWNEQNFDVNGIAYTKEAYEKKKYAFVSDYVRYWVLYNYGGIYFDTDVEVIAPMDDILGRGPYMGLQQDFTLSSSNKPWEKHQILCNPGLGMAAYPKMSFYKEMLNLYSKEHYILNWGKVNPLTVVLYTTNLFLKKGLVPKTGIMECEGIYIYPTSYFCPEIKEDGSYIRESETRTVHHWAATWVDKRSIHSIAANLAFRFLPDKAALWLRALYQKIIGRKDL